MATYITYQCSICRRTKNFIQDNVRSVPNSCTITKGCEGRLFDIGIAPSLSNVATSPEGLVDWYPRGQAVTVVPVEASVPTTLLSTSATGVLTLAIYQSDAEAFSRDIVKLLLTQRKVENISYQQYLFKTVVPTTLISGRDLTNKNMRFDQLAIDESRVFIRVNGISRFPGPDPEDVVLTPNAVSFNSATPIGATIDVSVYTEKGTIERVLPFVANRTFNVSLNSGSWGNVRWIKEYDSAGLLKVNKWWLYSCVSLDVIPGSARLKLEKLYAEDGTTVLLQEEQLNNIRILLASTPYENTDRYLNFYVDCAKLNQDFALSSVTTSVDELYADDALVEIFPPFQLIKDPTLSNSSFVTADTFTSSSSIPTDTVNTRIVGSKIIGPV